MNVGFVGLGKMGFNIVEHLLECDHNLVVFDLSEEVVAALAEKGAVASSSLQELAGVLQSPRILWLMVPAGDPVDSTLETLIPIDHDTVNGQPRLCLCKSKAVSFQRVV